MTPAQKKAETRARLEKNRQAARGFRVRRKDHVQDLELAITDFESRDRKQQRDIADLQRQIAKMQAALGNR
jgi:predicted  nucleic acid-binding Zn-ribbon protein